MAVCGGSIPADAGNSWYFRVLLPPAPGCQQGQPERAQEQGRGRCAPEGKVTTLCLTGDAGTQQQGLHTPTTTLRRGDKHVFRLTVKNSFSAETQPNFAGKSLHNQPNRRVRSKSKAAPRGESFQRSNCAKLLQLPRRILHGSTSAGEKATYPTLCLSLILRRCRIKV